ncbi:hypothetical protein [Anaerosporobacter sp.]
MKYAVVYKSKRSNKKLAKAIGEAIGVTPQELTTFDTNQDVDVLFFGASIYGGGVAPDVLTSVEKFKADKIKKVVLFSASGFGTNQYQSLIEKLESQGITVEKDVYTCLGRAFFFKNHSHPNTEEVKGVATFARKYRAK